MGKNFIILPGKPCLPDTLASGFPGCLFSDCAVSGLTKRTTCSCGCLETFSNSLIWQQPVFVFSYLPPQLADSAYRGGTSLGSAGTGYIRSDGCRPRARLPERGIRAYRFGRGCRTFCSGAASRTRGICPAARCPHPKDTDNGRRSVR